MRQIALAVALLATIACGQDGRTVTAPTPVAGQSPAPDGPPPPAPPPPAPSGPLRLTVIDGWTERRIAGAVVTLDGQRVVTDAAGQFEVSSSTACLKTTVVAPGYLERSLSCLPQRGTLAQQSLTLWPVANDAEREALRAFAFADALQGRMVRYNSQFGVRFAYHPSTATAQAWTQATALLIPIMPANFDIMLGASAGYADEGVVVAPFTTSDACNHRWYDVWPYAVSGFCMQRTEEYFVAQANVDPARLSTQAMALRVLMTFIGFRPHRLPGMFNDARSDDALSDFELRTLHMIGLRNKEVPAGVTWPDTEL